jgi:type VI secretion system secreted protein Hcp
MAIPLHLTLTDDDGAIINGSSCVVGREGSIEVLSFNHALHVLSDSSTGKLMAGRVHDPIVIVKEIDRSSPVLYMAVARGKTLRSGVLRWYRIVDGGTEEEYFRMEMSNIKIVSVSPYVPNIKDETSRAQNHLESVAFCYEKITWTYLDGNLIFADGWAM